MQFNSYAYLVFLALAVLLFWSLPVRLRRPFVLLASLLFYASWNLYFVALPMLVCVVMYVCGRGMAGDRQRSRFWLWCGVSAVIATLAFFKYRAFVWVNLSVLFHSARATPLSAAAAIALPLGISFYSFEAISYLVDARQGRVKSTSFLDLWLFVMFWPHLIAGPIVRARELFPQLKFDKTFDRQFVLRGLDRLIWGLVQKNLIANSLGSWVDQGFLPGAAVLNTTIDNWFLAAAFGLQIYFDFAAYSNMAIGDAQLIGIQLPENFQFPYLARNPVDFWSRWHMTLTRWIRDYLFFPINARYRGAPVPLYLSLLGTMAVIGLWHGAGWGFVLWGALHGAYLVLYRMFERLHETRLPQLAEARWVRACWRVFTLLAVTAAWVPFRAGTLRQALLMLESMFVKINLGHLGLSYTVNFYLSTLLIALFCVAEPYLGQMVLWLDDLAVRHRAAFAANAFLVRPFVYACGLFLFIMFDDRDTQFIYFQF